MYRKQLFFAWAVSNDTAQLSRKVAFLMKETKYIRVGRKDKSIIDAEDFELLSKSKWAILKNGSSKYARQTALYGRSFMHHIIMGKKDGFEIDHINRDGLDNRKENLRFCTHQENSRNRGKFKNNTSGFLGVTFDKGHGKYCAKIQIKGKKICRFFDTALLAARKRDELAIKYYGEFAILNFPENYQFEDRKPSLSSCIQKVQTVTAGMGEVFSP